MDKDPYVAAVLRQAAHSEPGHSLVIRGGELRADRKFWTSLPERGGHRGVCHRSDGCVIEEDSFYGELPDAPV